MDDAKAKNKKKDTHGKKKGGYSPGGKHVNARFFGEKAKTILMGKKKDTHGEASTSMEEVLRSSPAAVVMM